MESCRLKHLSKTGDLPKIPKHWNNQSLEDIAVINPSPKRDIDPQMDVTFLPMRNVQEQTGKFDTSLTRKFMDVKKGYRYFENGDIILAKITPCMENGKIAIVDNLLNDIGLGSTEFHVIRILDNYYTKFYFYFLNREEFRIKAKGSMTGSVGQKRVPTDFIKEMVVPIPPYYEQKKIIAKVDELFSQLDAGLASLQRTKLLLNQYRQAVLKAAMTGELSKEWREKHHHEFEPASVLIDHILRERRQKWEEEQLAKYQAKGKIPNNDNWKKKYTEPLISKDENLPKIPNKWVWGNLSQLSYFKNGINFTKEQKGNKGILTIDVLNMYSKGLYVILDGVYRVNKEVDHDYHLNSNDVLFVRSSVKREGVAWTSLFKTINEPVTYCGFIIRARLCSTKILPEYIAYYCRNNYARSKLIGKAGQVTITNINQNSLGGLEIPICCLSEQKEIIKDIEREFSIADSIEKQNNKNIQYYNLLKQAILKSAFEGNLIQDNSLIESKLNQNKIEEGETNIIKSTQTTLNGWKKNE